MPTRPQTCLQAASAYSFWVGVLEVLPVKFQFRIKARRFCSSVLSFCLSQTLVFPLCLISAWCFWPYVVSGAAGWVLLQSRGCCQGRWPAQHKGNVVLQQCRCKQDFRFNAASSVVFLLPAKLLNLPESSSFHSPFFSPLPQESAVWSRGLNVAVGNGLIHGLAVIYTSALVQENCKRASKPIC